MDLVRPLHELIHFFNPLRNRPNPGGPGQTQKVIPNIIHYLQFLIHCTWYLVPTNRFENPYCKTCHLPFAGFYIGWYLVSHI